VAQKIMPRISSLLPTFIKGRNRPWMLSIPAEVSPTGKRQQLFFATKKEAETASEQVKTRKANFGNSLSVLSPVRITEAAEAFSLLDRSGIKVSLLSVIKEHIATHKRRSQSMSLDALFESYLHARRSKSWQHKDKLKQCRERFASVGKGAMVSDLHHEDFEPILNNLTPSMRNAQMRLLRAVLNFGVKRGYLDTNPLNRLEFADVHKGEIQTVPVAIVEAMLKDAAANDIALLPFLVLGFFCGIRPNGELEEIEWRDISLEEKIVTIRAEVSKTRTRRFVTLSDNAIEWLNLAKGEMKSPSTRITPFTFNALRKKRRANWLNAREGHMNWIHQGMRHTFCSCWLAKHEDVNKLLLMSGHRSPEMLWRNYNRGTEKAEAERFWSIFPPKQEEHKVIAFPAAS
jgi:integrase/recombinase XerD